MRDLLSFFVFVCHFCMANSPTLVGFALVVCCYLFCFVFIYLFVLSPFRSIKRSTSLPQYVIYLCVYVCVYWCNETCVFYWMKCVIEMFDAVLCVSVSATKTFVFSSASIHDHAATTYSHLSSLSPTFFGHQFNFFFDRRIKKNRIFYNWIN